MWTARHVSVLTLALAVGACGKSSDKPVVPAGLEQDLAAAAASSGDLAGVPQNYQPMRFVSNVERSRPGRPSAHLASAPQRAKASHARAPESDAVSETKTETMDAAMAEAPTPVATPEAPTKEPVVVAQQPTQPTAAPAPVSQAGAGDEIGARDRGRGSGLGGLLGAIGGVIIRGGIGTVDKCDPRTDGRHGFPVIERPSVYGMPIPVGAPTFPGSRRH